MDSIQEIIFTMDKNQQKEFVFFIQRNKYRKGRKDLQLFNLLKEEKKRTPSEMVELLKTSNLNAYYTIRKRLFDHIADFIMLKSMSDDASPTSHINGLFSVVSYLFDKRLYEQAWKYLLDAEQLAIQNQFLEILNVIYLFQIEKAHLDSTIDLISLIEKYESNQVVLKQEERLKIASGVVRSRLNEMKEGGAQLNFHNLINDTLNKLNVSDEVLNTPSTVLHLMKIIRSGMIVKKDFHELEPYLIENYDRLYSDAEVSSNPMVQSEFLYLIAHACYRNKQFEKSVAYLHKMTSCLEKCTKLFQQKFTAKRTQLLAANLVFMNQLEDAIIEIKVLYERRNILSREENLNTCIILGMYHFLNDECKQALKVLNDMNHSDKWMQKIMGIEWIVKKNLMEIILFIDAGHIDIAESRIRTIERNYKHLQDNPLFSRVFHLTKLMKTFLYKHMDNIDGFHEQIKNTISFVSYEKEDIQAMWYYAWLKSKAVGDTFYSTLLGLVK